MYKQEEMKTGKPLEIQKNCCFSYTITLVYAHCKFR